MASPRPTRTSVLRTLVVTGLAVAATLSVVPTDTGNAQPRPSLGEVQQRVNALNAKMDVAVEQYAQSKLALATARRQAAVAQARVHAAEVALNAIRKSMGAVAAAAYRSGGTDQFVQLVHTSTPQTFLDRASSLNRIAAGQSAQMAAAATARHRLDTVRAAATKEQAVSAAVAGAMAAQKAQIEGALAEEQRLLSSLKADERARLNAQRQATAEAARASRSRDFSLPTYNGPASGRAAVAVREAYNQLGKPYSWGASGPGSFDCSGLTMWAWGHAGVSLSHSAAAQYDEGRHVSQADIQPGDLTFYGSPIHHVGIYIGGGNMISAPHSGDVVKIEAAFRSDYVGASRP